jgi:hypothetical protein
MEHDAEEDDNLKNPAFVKTVQVDTCRPSQEGRQDVNRNEDRHPQAADAVQDVRQHRALPFVTQGGCQADTPRQAHTGLLKLAVISMTHAPGDWFLNVTIILAIPVHTS